MVDTAQEQKGDDDWDPTRTAILLEETADRIEQHEDDVMGDAVTLTPAMARWIAGHLRARQRERADSAIIEALDFYRSVIKSGEPWTLQCREVRGMALDELDRLRARQREERLPDDDQVPVRRAYDGWSVYDEESLNWASESCEEAADQLGWKEHELDSLRVAGEAIKELLWRREQMKFMKRDLRNLRDATPQREREPVAWRWRQPAFGWHYTHWKPHGLPDNATLQPLYTEPPAEPDQDVYAEIGAALVLAYEYGRRLQDVVVRADVLGKVKSLAESADPEEDE